MKRYYNYKIKENTKISFKGLNMEAQVTQKKQYSL